MKMEKKLMPLSISVWMKMTKDIISPINKVTPLQRKGALLMLENRIQSKLVLVLWIIVHLISSNVVIFWKQITDSIKLY